MNILIVIGDQDSFHAEEHEIVSSPIWLADILEQEGVKGLFVVQARRAEILAQQRRHDVISALRRHEIGLHGRDVHPVLSEAVEGLDWHDGVRAVEEIEGTELELLGRVFDTTPVCSSQHRGHAPPQVFGVARQFGLPYLFGYPAAPPLHSVSWYAGALNVPYNAPVSEFLGFFPAIFDDVLHDDRAFEALLGSLQRHIARSLAANLPLLVVFTCHPERLGYSGPLEQWYYGNGINRGPAGLPSGWEVRRTRGEIQRALANFRRLICYLRDAPGLEPITVREMVQRYGQPAEEMTGVELARLAQRALAEHVIPLGETISPAEALLGFSEVLARSVEGGQRPVKVKRLDVLGPLEVPPLVPEIAWISSTQLLTSARELLATTGQTGHLPGALRIDGQLCGLGTLFGAFARAFLQVWTDGIQGLGDGMDLAVWPRYPELATAIGERQRVCIEDPLVRPGLSTDAAALHSRLQTWTLKPASRTHSR